MSNEMPVSEPSLRVLMIDLENCPNQIHQLMRNLEQFSQVLICYAQSGAKVPIDWIMQLTATVNDNRLKIVRMPSIGKNAADFGIAFWAGILMRELPPHTHFVIVSEDTDLDHVVGLLKSHGRGAERINTKKEEKPAVAPNPIPTPLLREYCGHLRKYQHNRPGKETTLLADIASKFKDQSSEAGKLLGELQALGAVNLVEGKVVYDDAVITRYAHP